jgi:hypothetical protein
LSFVQAQHYRVALEAEAHPGVLRKEEAAENPCREVKILKGEQHRTRYLLPEEEGRLMATLTGERSHLRDIGHSPHQHGVGSKRTLPSQA